jgi:hypothetical protein
MKVRIADHQARAFQPEGNFEHNTRWRDHARYYVLVITRRRAHRSLRERLRNAARCSVHDFRIRPRTVVCAAARDQPIATPSGITRPPGRLEWLYRYTRHIRTNTVEGQC